MDKNNFMTYNRIQPKILNAQLVPVSASNFREKKLMDEQAQVFYEFILGKIKYWQYGNINNVNFDLGQLHSLIDETQQQSAAILSTLYKNTDPIDTLKLLYNQAIQPDSGISLDDQKASHLITINDANISHINPSQNIMDKNKNNDQIKKRNLVAQDPLTSLSCSQCYDILVNQEFQQLNSRNQIITWRIRTCVFTGMKQLKDFFISNMVFIVNSFKESFRRFVSTETLKILCDRTKPSEYLSRLKDDDYFNVVYGLRSAISIPFYMLYIFVGFPIYKTVIENNIVNQELQLLSDNLLKKFEKQVEDKINQNREKYLDQAFFQFLNSRFDELSQMKFSSLDEEKFLSYIDKVKGVIKFQPNETSYKEQFFRLSQFYVNLIEKQFKNQGYTDEICRSFKNNFLSYIILKQYSNQLTNHNDQAKQCLTKLINEFIQQGLTKQAELIRLILEEFTSIYENPQQQATKQKEQNQGKVIIREMPANEIKFDYKFINYRFSIYTSFIGWKLVWFLLFIFQVFFYLLNFGFDQAINGYFGLKVAFLSQFERPTTISQMYIKICKSVEQSVQRFEDEENNGLLDKSLTRICNRVYYYGVKQFFIGIILVQILLRIFTILMSIILILLTPVVALLSPVISILGYFSSIFIFDFLSSERNCSWNVPIILPFFNLILFRLGIASIGKVFSSIFLFFAYYILDIFVFFTAIFMILIRAILNIPTYLILLIGGRIPNSDTWAAQKIKVEDLRDIEQQDSLAYLNNTVVKGQEHISQSKSHLSLYNKHMNKLKQSVKDKEYQKLTASQVILIVSIELKKSLIKEYIKDMNNYIERPMKENEENIKNILPFIENPNLGSIDKMCNDSIKTLLDHFNKTIVSFQSKLTQYDKRDTSVYPFFYTDAEYEGIFLQLKQFLITNQNLYYNQYWEDAETKQISQNNYDHLTEYYLNQAFFNENKRESNIKEKTVKSRQLLEIKSVFSAFCPQESYKTKAKKFIIFEDFLREAHKYQKVENSILSLKNLSELTLINANKLYQ